MTAESVAADETTRSRASGTAYGATPTSNWCGTHEVADADAQVLLPNAGAVAAFLADPGRDPATPVRFHGSRFSAPALLDARGAWAVRVARPSPSRVRVDGTTVTAPAELTLGELYDDLAARGLTLPGCPPVITEQTLAGAIATGTHAQGRDAASIGDALVAVHALDAAGKPYTLAAGDDQLGGLGLHLGVLGYLAEVTLDVVPDVPYQCVKDTIDTAALLAAFPTWTREHAIVKAWWFVDDDAAHVWRADPLPPPDARPADPAGPAGPDDRPAAEADARTDLNDVVERGRLAISRDTAIADATSPSQRTIQRFRDYRDARGTLLEVFRNGIPAPQINVEVAVPLDRFGEAAAAIRSVLDASPYRLHYPVILRPTGPSRTWLSPAYERPVCHVGFVVYQGEGGRVAPGSWDLVRALQRALADLDGLPHWGKCFDRDAYAFDRLLPRLPDFRALRDRLDPAGRLVPDLLAPILTPPRP